MRLTGGVSDTARLRQLLEAALTALDESAVLRAGPLPAGGPDAVARRIRTAVDDLVPAEGIGEIAALTRFARVMAAESVDPTDPACQAHLHCPPLAVAVAADAVASVLNPSLDSWDQAPAATVLESRLVAELAGLVGYDPNTAGGVFTSGGTESNLMGLLLAREAVLAERFGVDTVRDGLPAVVLGRMRVYTSAAAHFSMQRSVALLGLGESAVVAIPVDHRQRMDLSVLRRELGRGDTVPLVIAATAGTTDFGSIDPLPELAELARQHRTRLHVDAAYGGGALFSTRLAGLLDGIARADSIALDFHKFGWQPIAAGLFLAGRSADLAPLARQVAYLNPADDEDAGYTSLLHRSLRTSRRPDMLKVAVTLSALGRNGIGELVDACHELARYAADRIDAHDRLELTASPVLSTVVFRYRGPRYPDAAAIDAINAALRRELLATGTAIIGRTDLGAESGGVRLKFTLLNPHTTRADVDTLIAAVVAAGDREAGR